MKNKKGRGQCGRNILREGANGKRLEVMKGKFTKALEARVMVQEHCKCVSNLTLFDL